jgi:amino acid transporter
MVNYIAISILIVVCLIHYFSSRMGLFLNKLLALYKVILLLVMAFAGIAARNKPGSGKSASDWTSSRTVGTGFNSVSALIYVIYSYTGWENANYVIGEIDAAPETLRRGAFLAVTVATMAYTLITVSYFLACSSEDIAKNQSDLGMASIFAERVFGHTMGVKVCIALSAAGNLIAVVYTSSKVKQAIALHHYLPFSSFFAADGSFGTPGGALLLHGVCSAIVVLAIPNDTDGYGFLLGLFTYGQLMIGVVISLGFPRLAKKMRNSNPSWEPFLKNRGLIWLSGLVFALLNLFLLISAAWPRASGYIHRYWWPVTLTSVFAGSFTFWLCLRGLDGRLGEWIGWKAKIVEIDHSATPFEHYQSLLRRDGAESRVMYQLQSGKLVDKLKGKRKAVLDLVYEWIY